MSVASGSSARAGASVRSAARSLAERERGFSAEELERLFRAHSGAAEDTPPGEEDALREVAEHLSAAGATGEEMEQVMILVRAADVATRRAIAAVGWSPCAPAG